MSKSTIAKAGIALPENAPAVETEIVETEKARRGRRPLTQAEMVARIQSPLPHDVQFVEFAKAEFPLSEMDHGAQLVAVYMLGRNSTVREWYRDSDFAAAADEMVAELRAAEEARAAAAEAEKLSASVSKLAAKLTPEQKAALLALLAE